MKIYWASPLFTLTERKVNRILSGEVKKHLKDAQIFLPQAFKDKSSSGGEGTHSDCAAIFNHCAKGIIKADIVLANMDGCDSDSGTCWEVGYAYALGKPVIAFRTDYRPNQDGGLNIMPARSCFKVIHHLAFDEDTEALGRDIARAVKKAILKINNWKFVDSKTGREIQQAEPEATPIERIYWAAPLFSLTERKTNRALSEAIHRAFPKIQIYLPQDFKQRHRFNDRRSFDSIFRTNLEELDRADLIVAILDGCDADSGASWAVGYSYGRNKPIIGIRTDQREQQEQGLNIMLSRSCTKLVYRPNFDEKLKELVTEVLGSIDPFCR